MGLFWRIQIKPNSNGSSSANSYGDTLCGIKRRVTSFNWHAHAVRTVVSTIHSLSSTSWGSHCATTHTGSVFGPQSDRDRPQRLSACHFVVQPRFRNGVCSSDLWRNHSNSARLPDRLIGVLTGIVRFQNVVVAWEPVDDSAPAGSGAITQFHTEWSLHHKPRAHCPAQVMIGARSPPW